MRHIAHLPRAGLLALFAGSALAGCDPVSPERPETVTIQIDSDPSTSVRLITSDDFTVAQDAGGAPLFQLEEADTTWVDVPYSQRFDLQASGLFYARAAEADDPEAMIAMRAVVDGAEVYSHQGVLEGEGPQYYYVFR